MSLPTQPPESDLIVPLPAEGEEWDPWTIHTHYFGASVPEAELGVFLYIRYQPAFPLCQGGVCIFRGLDNTEPLDIDFLEPGKLARVTYESADGETSVDLEQRAISPLLMRGHVVPGEETDTDPGQTPGGSEQFMHATGKVVVRGESFDIDCFAPRDRSWRQVRTEAPGGARPMPPVGWSPMCFGEDLIFNQISFEHPDTNPIWEGLFEIPEGAPTHHFAWLYADGDLRDIVKVRRDVQEYHPRLHMATRQEIEAEDADGNTHRFRGEAIAMTPMPAWPNASFRDSVYRWESEDGRVAHGTYQELWFDAFQRAMFERSTEAAASA
jgi:hypothetical protein